MSVSSLIAATVVCTSLLSGSQNPDNFEHILRVSVDENNAKAEVREYTFRSSDAAQVEDVETLLVDANLAGPAKLFEVEDVVWFRQGDNAVMELFSNDSITWRLEAVLRVTGAQGEYETEYDYKTYSRPMTCKR